MTEDLAPFLAKLRADLTAVARASCQSAVALAASPWRTRREAAGYLRIGVDMIDKMKRRGVLTPKFIGSTPRYSTAQLDKILGDKPTNQAA